jgi:hypothetical protein
MIKEEKGTSSPGVKTFSSVLVTPSGAEPDGDTVDWMFQKLVPQNTGPYMPLFLKIWRPKSGDHITDELLINALSEASWDFPKGIWSSRNISSITLADRHARRVIRLHNGEPVLPQIHVDLRDSLYFI